MPFIGNKPAAVPLTSADIADSIITSAKIVDATIANADIANSTINLTTKVTGTLPVANGGTGLAALGTSLQVLRTNTGATALEFATPASGSYVFLGETSASNVSSASLDGYFTSSYDIYKIFIDGLYGASNDVGVRITFNKSGTEQTVADYAGSLFYQIATGSNAGSSSFDAAFATTYIFGAYSNSSSSQNGTCFDMTLYHPLGTNNNKVITFLSSNTTGDFTRHIIAMGSGMHRVQSAISGITIKMGSGNMYARKIKIYGVKNT